MQPDLQTAGTDQMAPISSEMASSWRPAEPGWELTASDGTVRTVGDVTFSLPASAHHQVLWATWAAAPMLSAAGDVLSAHVRVLGPRPCEDILVLWHGCQQALAQTVAGARLGDELELLPDLLAAERAAAFEPPPAQPSSFAPPADGEPEIWTFLARRIKTVNRGNRALSQAENPPCSARPCR